MLIVDDSRTICSFQAKTLQRLGHTAIVEPEDGVKALAKFKESVPDLVLIG